jgi:glycosyltransferase involved in cell wall biosynthesis
LATCHIYALQSSFGWCYAPAFRKWLIERGRNYDGMILHGNWQYPNLVASAFCKRHSIPYICFPHGMLDDWSVRRQGFLRALKKTMYWKLIEEQSYSRAAAVFFTTNRERNESEVMCRSVIAKCIVAPYGIPVEVGSVERPDQAEIQALSDAPFALFLSRVHPKKNLPFLLRSWAIARPDEHMQLVIAGPCERRYQDKLQRLCRQLDIERNVRFVGAVSGSDKYFLLQKARWFLLPSFQENFGIAVLEAAAAGCPVVISTGVYLSDYISTKETILPLEVDRWSSFLRRHLADDQFRDQIARQQRAELTKEFDFPIVAQRWRAQLEQIIGNRTASPVEAGPAYSVLDERLVS